MDKRYSKFAFAKRFDALGYNSFAKRSADLYSVDEQVRSRKITGHCISLFQLTEPEKRARYAAFAKRSRYGFAFAKRARFAFA
jgi:hypothetical protein